jgi:twitching motility protein PilT
MKSVTSEEVDQLLAAMIQSAEGVSDLLFVAGKPPQVESEGRLKPFIPEPPATVLTSESIEGLAGAIINNNQGMLQDLAAHGSCDGCYSLKNFCRFRVNIYRQNGNYAMVLRRLPSQIPSFESLGLPPVFRDIIKEKNGLVLVTGGTGSGKTSTLAAMLNEINHTSAVHVITLEDPIEFLHPHLKATFSQRGFGLDFFNFPDGLRAALRQAPKVILVGEIRDRATMEIALTASETGHLVFSTLHTVNASQTINRILGIFSKDEEEQVRLRLASSLRYVISQRLVPKQGGGRLLVTELMGSSLDTRDTITQGETKNRRLAEIIETGNGLGWHSFEQSLLKACEENWITAETALLNADNKAVMIQRLDALQTGREADHGHTTLRILKEADPASSGGGLSGTDAKTPDSKTAPDLLPDQDDFYRVAKRLDEPLPPAKSSGDTKSTRRPGPRWG